VAPTPAYRTPAASVGSSAVIPNARNLCYLCAGGKVIWTRPALVPYSCCNSTGHSTMPVLSSWLSTERDKAARQPRASQRRRLARSQHSLSQRITRHGSTKVTATDARPQHPPRADESICLSACWHAEGSLKGTAEASRASETNHDETQIPATPNTPLLTATRATAAGLPTEFPTLADPKGEQQAKSRPP